MAERLQPQLPEGFDTHFFYDNGICVPKPQGWETVRGYNEANYRFYSLYEPHEKNGKSSYTDSLSIIVFPKFDELIDSSMDEFVSKVLSHSGNYEDDNNIRIFSQHPYIGTYGDMEIINETQEQISEITSIMYKPEKYWVLESFVGNKNTGTAYQLKYVANISSLTDQELYEKVVTGKTMVRQIKFDENR